MDLKNKLAIPKKANGTEGPSGQYEQLDSQDPSHRLPKPLGLSTVKATSEISHACNQSIDPMVKAHIQNPFPGVR